MEGNTMTRLEQILYKSEKALIEKVITPEQFGAIAEKTVWKKLCQIHPNCLITKQPCVIL
jgi:hypothetical protein